MRANFFVYFYRLFRDKEALHRYLLSPSLLLLSRLLQQTSPACDHTLSHQRRHIQGFGQCEEEFW